MTQTVSYQDVSTSSKSSDAYSKVMLWLMLSFTSAGIGTMFLGPLVPTSMMTTLWMVALVSLIVSGFLRKVPYISPILAIFIPTILGVTLYPTLNYYFQTGSGNIVLTAAFGTAVTFGTAAVLGWRSKKNLNSIMPIMMGVLVGLIATSVLNVFVFKLGWLSFVISLVTIPLFALYSYNDLNRLRNNPTAMSPSSYALNIFLDVFNIFVSILNILGMTSRN